MGSEEALMNLIPVVATVEVIDRIGKRKKRRPSRKHRTGIGLYSRR